MRLYVFLAVPFSASAKYVLLAKGIDDHQLRPLYLSYFDFLDFNFLLTLIHKNIFAMAWYGAKPLVPTTLISYLTVVKLLSIFQLVFGRTCWMAGQTAFSPLSLFFLEDMPTRRPASAYQYHTTSPFTTIHAVGCQIWAIPGRLCWDSSW